MFLHSLPSSHPAPPLLRRLPHFITGSGLYDEGQNFGAGYWGSRFQAFGLLCGPWLRASGFRGMVWGSRLAIIIVDETISHFIHGMTACPKRTAALLLGTLGVPSSLVPPSIVYPKVNKSLQKSTPPRDET